MAVLGEGEPEWLLGVWRFSPLRLKGLIIKNGILALQPKLY